MSLAPNQPISVLVVDDSPFMRLTIQKILSQDPMIKVLDTARDGREGIEKLQSLKPQVVTMDVEMPVMNGLEALAEIMRWQPTPIIVLSSLATEGAESTLKALESGAFDVVAKPTGGPGADLKALAQDLIGKIKAAAQINPWKLKKLNPATNFSNRGTSAGTNPGANLGTSMGTSLATSTNPNLATSAQKAALGTGSGVGTAQYYNKSARPQASTRGNLSNQGIMGSTITEAKSFPKYPVEIVAIGTSTGGPSALHAVLPKLPFGFPVPVIVAQHMPPGFTSPLAQRLNNLCQLSVKEGSHGEVLKAGNVYIAPAGKQMQVLKRAGQLVLQIGDEAPFSTLYHPSVDVMFHSLAKETGRGTLAVVMTGMGNDGKRGAKEIKDAEGFAIAEAEESCVVYGMPRALVEAGLADRIVPLGEIGKTIIECVQRR